MTARRAMIRSEALVCMGLFVCAIATRARAADEPLPFQVHAVDSAECDASGSFAGRIEERSRRARLAPPGTPSLQFLLSVARDARGVHGELSVRELDGSETLRAISGASCDEVLSALTLIAVVLVDPNALNEPPAPRSAPSEPAPSEPARVPAAHERPWGFAAGVGLGVEGAVAPEVLVSLSPQVEVALGGDGSFSPRVALALERAFPAQISVPSGNVAHFAWTAARLNACPLRYPSSGPLALRPCALFDVGRLSASGDDRTSFKAKSETVTWLAAGAFARLELRPAAPLLLGLDAGFVTPLVRHSFYFEAQLPESTLKTPGIGLSARLGLAAYFE